MSAGSTVSGRLGRIRTEEADPKVSLLTILLLHIDHVLFVSVRHDAIANVLCLARLSFDSRP